MKCCNNNHSHVLLDRLRVLLKTSGGHSETKTLNQRDAVKAEGQKTGPQKVTHSGQVWDGEVVGVHTPPPHQTYDEVSNIKEDGDLRKEDKLLLLTDSASQTHSLIY